MDAQEWWAHGVDVTKPSPARVYDVHLGGSHHFQVDRDLAERAASIMPSLPAVLRANRAFLRRVVLYLVEHGVTQFLDLGAGIPTVGNVHETAQRANPLCRVAYVDNDAVAVAHSNAILRGNSRATAVRADLRDVDAVLDHAEVRALLDFDQPIVALFIAVLHFIPDSDRPAEIVARYVRRLASGSFVAIAQAGKDNVPENNKEAAALYSERVGGFFLRSTDEIGAMFGDLPLVEPGLVEITNWRPDDARGSVSPAPGTWSGPGGVARKP
jgi:hypothetical protein